MNEKDQRVIEDFLLPQNIVFFKIGEAMQTRKFVAASAKIYIETTCTVTLELKGKSPTGCVAKFKMRLRKEEAKELAKILLQSL